MNNKYIIIIEGENNLFLWFNLTKKEIRLQKSQYVFFAPVKILSPSAQNDKIK